MNPEDRNYIKYKAILRADTCESNKWEVVQSNSDKYKEGEIIEMEIIEEPQMEFSGKIYTLI